MFIDWSPWSFGCSEGSISATVGLQKKLLHFKYSNADLPYTCVFRKNEFFYFLGKLQIYLSKYIPFWVITSISQTGCYIPFGWLKYTCMFWSCMQALKSEWNINHTIADFLDLHYVVPWISYSIKWFIHICSPYKTL